MKKKVGLAAALVLLLLVAAAVVWHWHFQTVTADDYLAAVKHKGTLVVGADIPFGVMEFMAANKQPAGIDIDIAKEIAKRLEVKLEIKDYQWTDLFTGLNKKDLDLAISSITITPERQKKLLFSDPYFNGGQVIVVRSDNKAIRGVDDLKDKQIATQVGTTSYFEAKKYTPESSIHTYVDFGKDGGTAAIVDDLKSGKFDLIIVDYNQALDLIKQYAGLKIIGAPFTKETYGIAARLGSDSLIKAVNDILADMEKDGSRQSIISKWTKF